MVFLQPCDLPSQVLLTKFGNLAASHKAMAMSKHRIIVQWKIAALKPRAPDCSKRR